MKLPEWLALIVGIAVLLAICWMTPAYRAHAAQPGCGEASWYGTESGNRTATGSYFDGTGMTAAMPSRSMLGKRVRVTNMRTGKSIVVLIDDLGPAARLHRVIDLSRHAARVLGIDGLGRVCISTP